MLQKRPQSSCKKRFKLNTVIAEPRRRFAIIAEPRKTFAIGSYSCEQKKASSVKKEASAQLIEAFALHFFYIRTIL